MKLPRLLVSAVALAALGWTLHRLGSGSLGVPLGSSDDLATWMDDSTPAVMAVALLRLVALASCGYLAAVVTLATLAELAGCPRLAVAVARALPAALRRTALGGAQLGLAAGAVLVPVSPVAAARLGPVDRPAGTVETATMIKLDSRPGQTGQPPATTTMVSIGPPGRSEPEPTPPSTPIPAAPQPPNSPMTRPPDSAAWVVGSGDSFWSIAEAVLAEQSSLGGPDEISVGRYWRRLIDANLDRLAAPGHPDVLLPGQRLVVPPP